MRYSLIATTLTKSHGFHIAMAISKGLFETLRVLKIICVPEGTRNFQVTGSVIVWFDKKATEEEKRMPGLVAMLGVKHFRARKRIRRSDVHFATA
jgi:hypothetical protein